MSILSAWDFKIKLLATLSLILAIIVAVQGAVLYKVAKNYTPSRHNVAVTTVPAKSQPSKPGQVGPNVGIGASPGMWDLTPFSSENAWDQIDQFHQRMDQLFADTFAQPGLGGMINENLGYTVPSMDLRDDKDHYTVRMDMPGADKDTIKVNVEGNMLTVSGQRETSTDTKDSGNRVIRSERSTARFERAITLPTPVKPESVTADYTNGVLTINLPKSDKVTRAMNVTVQ